MKAKTEKLYMLRVWQEEEDENWRTSLKPITDRNEPAHYFQNFEALKHFLELLVKNLNLIKD